MIGRGVCSVYFSNNGRKKEDTILVFIDILPDSLINPPFFMLLVWRNAQRLSFPSMTGDPESK